jgi:hypothetical protein
VIGQKGNTKKLKQGSGYQAVGAVDSTVSISEYEYEETDDGKGVPRPA